MVHFPCLSALSGGVVFRPGATKLPTNLFEFAGFFAAFFLNFSLIWRGFSDAKEVALAEAEILGEGKSK